MAARIYRLTAAGREAWEGEDAAVPADYRRILWMMDLHGSAPETLEKVFPAEMLEEWLSELEEIGLIEPVPEGEGREDDFAARGSDQTHALDRKDLGSGRQGSRRRRWRAAAPTSPPIGCGGGPRRSRRPARPWS